MKKRISNKIEANKNKIVALLNENIDLGYELFLLNGKRFEEKEVNRGTNKNPVMEKVKVMFWDEWFKDEDRPKERGVRVERQCLVEVEGKPIKKEYFTTDDI